MPIPGLILPGAAGIVIPPKKKFTFVGSASRADISSGNLTMPTGIEAGDAIVVCQIAADSVISTAPNSHPGAPSAAYGTGFTSLGTDTWNTTFEAPTPPNPLGSDEYCSFRACVSWKTAAGTESGASIGGFMNFSGIDQDAAVIIVYRPDAGLTLSVQDFENNAGNTTINSSGNTTYAVAPIAFRLRGDNDPASVDGGFSGLTADVTINNLISNSGDPTYGVIDAWGANAVEGSGANVSVTATNADAGFSFYLRAI